LLSAILHQLDGLEQSHAAHVADQGMLGRQIEKLAAQISAHFRGN
jgi:hypothetical protein